MPNKQRAYVSGVAAAGLCALLYSLWSGFARGGFSLACAQPLSAFVLLVLLVLCRNLPLQLAADKFMDVSFVPVAASVLLYGPEFSVSLFAASSLLVFLRDPATHKLYNPLARKPLLETFNIANILVSILLGSLLIRLFWQSGLPLMSLRALAATALFATASIVCNLVLFIFYFQAGGMGRFGALMYENISGIVPNIIATVPFGLVLALVLTFKNGAFLVLLFTLPLLLARYSFKLYLESHSQYLRTVTALSSAIEAKDAYTRGHSERVAAVAVEIARAMRLRNSMVEQVRVAALLHDVGKIGVDDSILRKPGALTDEEFDAIRQHPVVGRRIVEDIRLSEEVNQAVLYHHYGYDGRGYPQNGPGPGNLPLAAAILAVADTYDAITSDRPYRPHRSHEEAVQVIREVAGTQLDPKVVDAFLQIAPKLAARGGEA